MDMEQKMKVKNAMENMKKKMNYRIVIAIILMVVLLFAIMGTVYMFMTEVEKSRYVSGSYSYYYGYSYGHYVYYYTDMPEAGAMPLVGTLLFIAAVVCLFLSGKKEKLIPVASVLMIIGAVLMYASVGVIGRLSSYVFYADIGYPICCAAASVAIVLAIINFVLYRKSKAAPKEQTVGGSYSAGPNYHAFASELSDAKALLDSGIFSNEEYEREKARIFDTYGFGPGSENTTTSATTAASTSAKTFGPRG